MNMNYQSRLEKTLMAIQNADYILIGGGSGLSVAGGLCYSGKRFTDSFPEFISLYGMTDMYSAGFYPFGSQEEKWAYWSRHIRLNRYDAEIGKVYLDLRELIKDKNYFVLTTNVDAQFYKAGFRTEKIFAVQGDYGKFQCAKGCHRKLYDNEKTIQDMIEQQQDCHIPTILIPRCPVCGGAIEVNIRKDEFFVQDEHWDNSHSRFEAFIRQAHGNKLTLLEIGVGFNTPTIIRIPFEQITYQEPQATLIRINKDDCGSIIENNKTICFNEPAEKVIDSLRRESFN